MLIQTSKLDSAALRSLSEPVTHQLYCGLDCCVTLEVFEELRALLSGSNGQPNWPLHYSFERALQAPALDMMLRGFRIDRYEQHKGLTTLQTELEVMQAQLNELAAVVWLKPLNANSPKQLKEFFYGAMRLPEIWTSFRGERSLSMNRETLEKLEQYYHARPIIALILEARDLAKRRSVLQTEVSSDGRMRTSYNIGGTNTGRWSSSANAEGSGTNLQNIPPELRKMFVADSGWKLCGIDLEQAESREVGWLCGTLFEDWTYLNMCESGDLHTETCKLIWPALGWAGERTHDRRIADRKFYRDFTYRDMSKRGGHGSNYLGTPWTMARHLKVPTAVMEQFQASYFAAFPAIPRWHQWVAQQLQTRGVLVTPFGRERMFFGRRDDDATLRKAIAYSPQSSTGDRLNLGLWKIWKYMPEVQLLAQVHDAVYFQYRECDPDEERHIVGLALELVQIPLEHKGRHFTVPGEAKIGWNWASAHNADGELVNPDGLVKFNAAKPDMRKRTPDLERIM